MGLFHKKESLSALQVADNDIVAMADSTIIPVSEITDEVFATESLGTTCAFRCEAATVTICAPANGKLTVMYPTGHAFSIAMADGTELLVHIGVDTVNENGRGFKVLASQGDQVRAGQPIVEVDYKKLMKKYDMSTMLIVTNPDEHPIAFRGTGEVHRGDSILKKG